MKQEIDAGLDLLISYIQRFGSIKQEDLEIFRTSLQHTLVERYQGHWYPDKPIKGQAFRSLEFNKDNDYCDVIVAQICQQLGFAFNVLGIRHELILWIDPFEVTIRLGNHALPKENQQLIVVRFDRQGNELIRNDLDYILSQSRASVNVANVLGTTTQTSRLSPSNSSTCDSASCSGSSTPQRASSPHPLVQMTINNSTLTPAATYVHHGSPFAKHRTLSPQAPSFQMSPSAPIKVPNRLEIAQTSNTNNESISCEGSPSDGNHFHMDRSDTPHSMHSTTSNESTDSGYCGYVESFPYYYKLNRLYKALAIQKISMNGNPVGKNHQNSPVTHHRRTTPALHQYHPQQQQTYQYGQHPINNIPNSSNLLSNSPPTPTPMNINQLSPFYNQTNSYFPMSTAFNEGRKTKY